MSEDFEFHKFDKIPRLRRDVVITEKLDGTNGQILVVGKSLVEDWQIPLWPFIDANTHYLLAGSKNRWLDTTKNGDNYNFCRWVNAHKEELITLGEGRHFGEWWGQGIQRRYDMDWKAFSLFNTGRWHYKNPAPSCCNVVPVLAAGMLTDTLIETTMDDLGAGGSVASPGFMKPEGIVIFMTQARRLFKITLENDGVPKSLPKPKKDSTVMKSSQNWMKDYPSLVLIDADGWDRSDFTWSFHVERITLAEFNYRVGQSTCEGSGPFDLMATGRLVK
jgi:hypothetical protein